mgnify:CR=1 FL=1
MFVSCCFFFQAEDGIRGLVRSRGLGDVYKRQVDGHAGGVAVAAGAAGAGLVPGAAGRRAVGPVVPVSYTHLTLPTIYPV